MKKKLLFVLLPASLLAACCPPYCGNGGAVDCHTIPDVDDVNPVATITIEYWTAAGQPKLEEITTTRTITVDERQRFNILYTGRDNVGVNKLWLDLRWTQWNGGVPQSVTPTIAPETFGDNACSPRIASSKFVYQQPRIYRFTAHSEDYHGNQGISPALTVIHGEPPAPLTP